MNVLRDGEIVLNGTVGEDFWGEGFTYTDVLAALAEVGRASDVVVHINSGGGYATEGVAIFNAFRAHRGNVTMIVEAIAASAASLIAMAGDEVVMRTGAIMMIHDPATWTSGNAEDHEKSVEALNALGASMADIYAEKTGRSAEECRAEMREEIWLTAQEAVERKYADRTDAARAGEPIAFNYRLYENAPERMVALADARSWTGPVKPKAADAAAHQESSMPKETETGGAATQPTQPIAKVEPTQPSGPSAADVTARASEIATLCAAAGVPAMAGSLIREGATVEQAKARIDGAKDIRAAVDLARRSCPAIEASLADTFIAAGTSIEGVRADLFNRIASAQTPEITAAHQAPTGQTASAADIDRAWASIVDRRHPAAAK